jgi:acyl-CoA synthetase (AMP-forming)/AMP-acid ligase II
MEIITIKEMLERNAETYRDRVAFQMKEGKSYCQITYGNTLHLVGRIQTVLIKTGIKSGDRVALNPAFSRKNTNSFNKDRN